MLFQSFTYIHRNKKELYVLPNFHICFRYTIKKKLLQQINYKFLFIFYGFDILKQFYETLIFTQVSTIYIVFYSYLLHMRVGRDAKSLTFLLLAVRWQYWMQAGICFLCDPFINFKIFHVVFLHTNRQSKLSSHGKTADFSACFFGNVKNIFTCKIR